MKLLTDIRSCVLCASHLPNKPRPIIQASPNAKILIIGQAPGAKVQASGIPWDDASGERLRKWLGVDKDLFYDPNMFALMPMGFCYPGKLRGGDAPPRPECAPKWHGVLLNQLSKIELTILIGQYSQRYYLKESIKGTLTETVKSYREYLPEYLPIPHPSPRNQHWFKNNLWFEQDILPLLKTKVESFLHAH